MRRRRSRALLLCLFLPVVACGAAGPSTGAPPAGAPRIVYDGDWTVEDGQWWIGNGETYSDADPSTIPSYRRLIESVGEAAVITAPNADGRYRTVVELLGAEPTLPDWCEDAAESSVRMDADPSALQMGSVGSFAGPVGIPAGWYRIRYCTEQQDLAAEQDAVASAELRTFAGRHLIQLWPAPQAPDRTLREGSTFARMLAAQR